jgi:hypothetical protein
MTDVLDGQERTHATTFDGSRYGQSDLHDFFPAESDVNLAIEPLD